MPRRHVVKRNGFHYKWSKNHRPVLYAESGDTITLESNEVTSGQITRNSNSQTIMTCDRSKEYPLTGPIYVQGAKPGDALSVHIVNLKVDDWGWTSIDPTWGVPLEEFTEHYLWIWKLRKRYAPFKNGIKIPIRPFCGVMGVAPPEDGFFEVVPPGKHGGNMDIRHLTAGSTLLLPVWVDGALFSIGDMHAAQGDGEVCGTAIECPGEVTVKLEIVKDAKIEAPRYACKIEPSPRLGYYVTTGISPDLMSASKQAVRGMIGYLSTKFKLTRQEAYILCSVAADLRIHEMVDIPNWIVGAMIPQDIFPRTKGKSRGSW